MTKSKYDLEVDGIIEAMADLECRLYKLSKPAAKKLRDAFGRIECAQMYGIECPEPRNPFHWWSLSTVDLIHVLQTHIEQTGLELEQIDAMKERCEALAKGAS
jgi:hypothetical protein